MKLEARHVLQTSMCTAYLPPSMQSPYVNWALLLHVSHDSSAASMAVCVCVCVGLTRTLPKAPMATSGGSSIGRAYVPPTCSSSSGGKGGRGG